jgi:hypothetical protein
LLDVLPKEKIARFRIENHQFQHPERKEFPDGKNLVGADLPSAFATPGNIRQQTGFRLETI